MFSDVCSYLVLLAWNSALNSPVVMSGQDVASHLLPSSPASSPLIEESPAVGWCAGKELLQSLEKGSAVRKKWVTHMRPAEIASASKTTRTVRCLVKDSNVCLRYSHQVRSRLHGSNASELSCPHLPCF
jgi:hypothetical protein